MVNTPLNWSTVNSLGSWVQGTTIIPTMESFVAAPQREVRDRALVPRWSLNDIQRSCSSLLQGQIGKGKSDEKSRYVDIIVSTPKA
jgi:hypothetical protein